MAFIEIHRGKKLNAKYEYGFYAGTLFTSVLMLATFLLDFLSSSHRYFIFFWIIFMPFVVFGFVRTKAKSANILEESETPHSKE